jgi:hypothetical protein
MDDGGDQAFRTVDIDQLRKDPAWSRAGDGKRQHGERRDMGDKGGHGFMAGRFRSERRIAGVAGRQQPSCRSRAVASSGNKIHLNDIMTRMPQR